MQGNCENRDGYISVEGKDAALKLAKALLEANRDMQVLIQEDDCDIYIVTWADAHRQWGDAYRYIPNALLEGIDNLLSAKLSYEEMERISRRLHLLVDEVRNDLGKSESDEESSN